MLTLKKGVNIFQDKTKKCTGESGDIGDIAKIVNIAMQKNDMAKLTKLANFRQNFVKIAKIVMQIFIEPAWYGGQWTPKGVPMMGQKCTM